MPKHRKRRIMLSIVSIVLFVVLSAQLSTFSFSVTAAGNAENWWRRSTNDTGNALTG